MVDDRLNEEDETKHVLSELHKLGVDHADFDSKFDSLADSVRAQADRQEHEEFAHRAAGAPGNGARTGSRAVRAGWWPSCPPGQVTTEPVTSRPVSAARDVGTPHQMTGSAGDDDRTGAERGFALLATWSMRWLLIALALWALFQAGRPVTGILVPVAIAILLAALLGPVVRQLRGWGWPRWLAAVTVLLGGLALVGGVVGFVVMSFLAGLPDLLRQLTTVVRSLHEWAVHGPLGLAPERIGWLQQEALGWLQQNQQQLTQGVMSTVFTLGSLLTSALLVVFSLVFFLYEGERLWRRTCGVLPERHRERVAGAGRDVFRSLTAYTRATTVVAIADAIGIGIGLFALGVPLAGPLTALVFLGGFLPVLGALVSGVIAVLITLVTKGLVTAVIVLAIVVVVQQLEGNVLQPWLVGDAARVHPLVVVLAVTAGGLVTGVIGALLAVPVVITVRCVFLALVPHEESEQQSSG